MPLPRYKLTHYTVLGVSRIASADEIKAAFKVRAKTLHPDLNQHRDTTADFQRLQTAYSVLSDPEQRAAYDLNTFPIANTAAEPTTASTPKHRVSPMHVEPTARRPRGCLPVVIAIVILGGSFLFFEPSPTSDSPSSTWVLPEASSKEENSGLDREMQALMAKDARSNYFPTATTPAEVEILGRDGRKHVISSVSAKLLEPIKNKLFIDSEQLRERERTLKDRRDGLERNRRTLNPSIRSEIEGFNKSVAALNRESGELERDLDAHKKEIDAFFAELARETLRIL